MDGANPEQIRQRPDATVDYSPGDSRMSGASRTSRGLLIALAIASTPAPTGAQEIPWQAVFHDQAEVNVVNLDVVVSDRDGRPVTGLSLQDFTLLEDGKPVEISNFYEVVAGRRTRDRQDSARDPSAGPSDPRLDLVVFIDQANLQARNRRRVFSRLREFLRSRLPEGSRVMLTTNEHALVIRQDLTSDMGDVLSALDEIEASPGPTLQPEMEYRDLVRAMERINDEAGTGFFGVRGIAAIADELGSVQEAQQRLSDRISSEIDSVLPLLRTYSSQRLQQVLEGLQALGNLMDLLAGMPGRKAVLVVSEGMPLRPGEALYESLASLQVALPGFGSNISPLEGTRDDATRVAKEVLSRANSARVALYSLYAAPGSALERRSAASVGTAGGNFASWDDNLAAAEELGRQEALALMADETGGRYSPTLAAREELLEGLVGDHENYYSLGYPGEPRAEGRPRNLRVQVSNKKWRVRHRRRFHDRTLAERAAYRTRSALLTEPAGNPLGIAARPQAIRPQEKGTFLVPLLVEVPLGRVVLLPGAEHHQTRISIFVAVRDAKGRVSDTQQHLCPIRIPNSQIPAARAQRAGCGIRLLMRQGRQRIAVSLLDELAAKDSTIYLELNLEEGRAGLASDSVSGSGV